MSSSKFSRRYFMKGLGAGAALLPILEADFARGATAFPRRVLIVMQTNGVIANQFFPGSPGDLTNVALPRCTAPLNDFRSDLIMLSGLEPKNFTAYGDRGAGHESFSTVLTGAKGLPFQDAEGPRYKANSATVDQYIVKKLIASGVKTPFSSLDLAVWMEHYWYQARCFYKGSDDPVNPEQDPAKAFAALFAGAPMPDQPTTGTAMTDEKLKRLQVERKSILDFLGDDITSFATRLGKSDRERVQSHLESIRELEGQIAATAPGAAGGPTSVPACQAPTLAALPGGSKPNDNQPKVFEQHIDLIVNAFKCDLTRVATLMTNNANGLITTLNWLDVPSNVDFGPKNYHGTAHAGGEGKIKTDEWYMKNFALLLRKMKDVKEGDGTMLDNTVVLWANHMGNGGAHNVNDLPWILAGKGGGYFKTGQYIKKNASPTNGVLKALCSAMQVDPAGFGDAQWGSEFAELRR